MRVYIDITRFISNFFTHKYLSGIQRVVKEVVVRFLSDKNFDVILMEAAPSASGFKIMNNPAVLNAMTGGEIIGNIYSSEILLPGGFEANSVLLDIDSVWGLKERRSDFYPQIKRQGVKIAVLVYDVIPVFYPYFAEQYTAYNFMFYAGAVIEYADLVITNTRAVEHSICRLCEKYGIRAPKFFAAPLGSDFNDDLGGAECIDESVIQAVQKIGKYVLMVGTIEPRKNHRLVIDALEQYLDKQGVKVVIAGKFGWNVSDLRERMLSHPLLKKSLFFYERPSDAVIRYLYANAYLVAFPTQDEGFGLPVIESLYYGTPVVASDIDVLREIGSDNIDYFEPNNTASFADTVLRLYRDTEYYNKIKEKIKDFVPFSWEECATRIKAAVRSLDEPIAVERVQAIVETGKGWFEVPRYNVAADHQEAAFVYKAYADLYVLQKKIEPTFLIYNSGGTFDLLRPTYIELLSKSKYNILIEFDDKMIERFGDCEFYWWFEIDNKSVSELNHMEFSLKDSLKWSIQTPRFGGNYTLKMGLSFDSQEAAKLFSMAAFIV